MISSLSRETIEKADEALSAAWSDIRYWLQLAKRQRKELPDADHLPCAPTTVGIAVSEGVLTQIADALSLLRSAPASCAPSDVEPMEDLTEAFMSSLGEVLRESRSSPQGGAETQDEAGMAFLNERLQNGLLRNALLALSKKWREEADARDDGTNGRTSLSTAAAHKRWCADELDAALRGER